MTAPYKLDIYKPFLLNNYQVDPQKGLITAPKSSIKNSNDSESSRGVSVEPKVMAVLLLLVKHQGKLVSQERIFEQVWPNSIFSPSSIQRCIALLRKVFADDAKTQQVIKTHPKRGYSLQANLYQEGIPVSDATSHNANNKLVKHAVNLKFITNLLSVSTLLILIVIILSLRLYPKQDQSFQKVSLQALSYSQANEYYPRFSNDLRYTAYIKETDSNYQIWLRESSSEHHQSLYQSKNPILSLAWLSDNQSLLSVELVYINDQSHFIINRIQVVDKAISIKPLHSIKGFIYLDNIFIADDHLLYAMVKKADTHRSVILRFDLVTGKQEIIDALPDEHNITNIALSNNGKHLAVIAQSESKQTQLFDYDIATSTLTYRVTLNSANYQLSWHPDNKTLLLNDGQYLCLLNADEHTLKVNYTSFSKIQDASFAGKTQIAFSLVNYDTDIISYSLAQNFDEPIAKTLVNSTQIDKNARISPSGKALAFVSKRNGKLQLYWRESGVDKPILSTTKTIKKVSAPLWQTDSSLLVAVDGKLLQVSSALQQHQIFEYDGYILQLLSWHPNSDSLLLAYEKQGQIWIGRYYPKQQKMTPTYQISPEQAAHAIANEHIVLIHNSKLFLVTENAQLELLYETNADNIEMSTNSANGMYFQTRKDSEQQLWRFDFEHRKARKIMDIPKNQLLIDISQDEKTALFQKTEQEMNIVLLQSIEQTL